VPTWLAAQDDLDASRVETVRPAQSNPVPRMHAGHLRLADEIDLVSGGGKHGLGYLRGRRSVQPDDWYFDCHFHRDPVMPGSLGVEAVIEALKHFVARYGEIGRFRRPVFAPVTGVPMSWSYRGQILREDKDMTFEVHITDVRQENDRLLVLGDASVWKAALRIYELTGVAVAVREDTEQGNGAGL
jgi:3-hydroxymyristoyl/3-hydroxydecanoyl-(acyl carrier protein) dehydratase